MSVRIEFDSNQPWYTNHDTLSGRIEIDLRASAEIQLVSVGLVGVSRTALERVDDVGQKFTDHEDEDVVVLDEWIQLFPPAGQQYAEKYSLPSGSHSWRFKFTLPATPRPGSQVPASRDHDTALLPPSLSDLDRDEASVRYAVKANVDRGGRLASWGGSSLSATRFFVFLPSDPPLEHIPTYGVYHTAHSRVISSSRTVSGLFTKLVSSLAHDRAPVCTSVTQFEVRSELLLTPGLKFSWVLSALPLKAEEQVTITAVRVELVSRTYVRAKNLNKNVEKSVVLLERTNLKLRAGDITSQLGDPALIIPETVAPSFTVANLRRSYRLETKIKWSHRPSSVLVHKALVSRPVWIRSGMHLLPSYDTGEIVRADRGFPQANWYFKKT